MHKFLDAFLENIEQDIWCDLEAPLFESFCESQELLKVLRELVIIVYAIEAELDIWLNLLIVLNKFVHANTLDILAAHLIIVSEL